jgi:hypothetical protein
MCNCISKFDTSLAPDNVNLMHPEINLMHPENGIAVFRNARIPTEG